MRKCPICGEEIKEEAIFCRFCRSDIEPPIWMSSLQKCPYCAEWVEQGLEECPLCGRSLEGSITRATVHPPQTSPDELIANFRRETRSETYGFEAEVEVDEPQQETYTYAQEGDEAEEPELQSEPEEPPRSRPFKRASLAASIRDSQPVSSIQSRRLDEPGSLRPISDLLPKEDSPRSSRPRLKAFSSIFRGIFVLLLVGVIGVGIVALAVGPGRTMLAEVLTPEDTPTEVILPTSTFPSAATLPPVDSTQQLVTGCLYWDQITTKDEDRQVCVYGIVRRWFSVSGIPFVAIFSEEIGTFAFVDYENKHPEVRPGVCITGVGRVQVMRKTRPFIDVTGKVEFCPEDMETSAKELQPDTEE